MSRIETHFSVRTLGGKLVPGKYNKSTLVSEFQDKHKHLSSEISSPKFHQKMTFASPASRKIIGLGTVLIWAMTYNCHVKLL